MNPVLEAANPTHPTSMPAPGARPRPWRRAVVWVVIGWTLLVVLALGWLFRGGSGPAIYIMHGGAPGDHPATETVRAWFKADLGVQRAYPWLLLGPYVALVALCFPLERGKLGLHIALNLAACVGFLVASHAISGRTTVRGATVVILRPRPQVDSGPSATPGTARGGFGTEPQPSPTSQDAQRSAKVPQELKDISAAGRSNLQAQLQPTLHPAFTPPPLPGVGVLSLLLDLVAYCAILGLAHSVHFYRRFREREHQTLLLESNLNQARLNALRAQLQPHFLFNSLNAIAALLRRDPRLAEAMLLSLSELLRLALSQSERQLVALREEISLVARYLEIQQTRFGDKLRVEQNIDPAALECLVPTLLLQPVVENALRHGIEPADNDGLVRLTAQRAENRLVLTVADNGVGLNHSSRGSTESGPAFDSPGPAVATNPPGGGVAVRGTGIGLSNLRARLVTLYGAQQKLQLASRPEGGVEVRIEIPWQPVGIAETAALPDPL